MIILILFWTRKKGKKTEKETEAIFITTENTDKLREKVARRLRRERRFEF